MTMTAGAASYRVARVRDSELALTGPPAMHAVAFDGVSGDTGEMPGRGCLVISYSAARDNESVLPAHAYVAVADSRRIRADEARLLQLVAPMDQDPHR